MVSLQANNTQITTLSTEYSSNIFKALPFTTQRAKPAHQTGRSHFCFVFLEQLAYFIIRNMHKRFCSKLKEIFSDDLEPYQSTSRIV